MGVTALPAQGEHNRTPEGVIRLPGVETSEVLLLRRGNSAATASSLHYNKLTLLAQMECQKMQHPKAQRACRGGNWSAASAPYSGGLRPRETVLATTAQAIRLSTMLWPSTISMTMMKAVSGAWVAAARKPTIPSAIRAAPWV